MSRDHAIQLARHHFDSGNFLAALQRRVAHKTLSQNPSARDALIVYLTDEIAPTLEALGFQTPVYSSSDEKNVFLIATRLESHELPTVLLYGHGDVLDGMDGQWTGQSSPWTVTVSEDRIYGRGTADNKGQHSINIAALDAVLEARSGRLGFNTKILLEMGEENSSPGLKQFCRDQQSALAADILIASDGPRLSADRPTLFLGARGNLKIRLTVDLRPRAYHSGNWGGLLANPATILASAIASLVDHRGRILVDALRPPPIPSSVRSSLADVVVTPSLDEPALSEGWGEPGLTPAERVFGWSTLEVLAFGAGNLDRPVNAIPGKADAVLQLRFVVGTPATAAESVLRAHLDAHGFSMVAVSATAGSNATRLDPSDPWAKWAFDSIQSTTGKSPALLPNFGGSLPNEVFAEDLNLSTLWVPHSYPGCNQHAPDEHLLASVAREGLEVMAGLFWDLGETGHRLTERGAKQLIS